MTDLQGKEYTAAQVQRSAPPNLRVNQFSQDRMLQSNEIERISTSIPPWNWQLNHYVTFPLTLSAIRFQREMLVSLSILFMLLAAAGVVWMDRARARRLTVLTETLQRFGAGEPTARSRDQSSDELGRLSDAFNCMADDLAHAQKKLQKQLAEHEQSPNAWKQQLAEFQTKCDDLERFAASTAHELKAPLATMQGFARDLEPTAKAGDWDRFQHDVFRIQQAGKNLQATVDTLLRLAKVQPSAKLSEAVSLQTAANEAVELLCGNIDPQRIQVVISGEMPTVPGDSVLWRQVFQNLIDNSLNACRDVAAVKIEIGCERRDGQLVCFVRDNGAGLSPHDVAQLFVRPPSGLGLPLVQKIITLSGGKVWAERREPGTQITWSCGT